MPSSSSVCSPASPPPAPTTKTPRIPLLTSRPVENVGILHITPDRGLCGALNGNLNRAAGSWVASQEHPVTMVSVGKKGRDFFARARTHMSAEFIELGDYPRPADTTPIARVVTQDFISGAVDEVYISYPRFISTASQVPTVVRLLPIETPTADEGSDAMAGDYLFEPSPQAVFERLLPRYVDMIIYQAVLENSASFQAAQMVAMKNATDNATEIRKNSRSPTTRRARSRSPTNCSTSSAALPHWRARLARFAAVVFDMDGVLVDGEPLHFACRQPAPRRRGQVHLARGL